MDAGWEEKKISRPSAALPVIKGNVWLLGNENGKAVGVNHEPVLQELNSVIV